MTDKFNQKMQEIFDIDPIIEQAIQPPAVIQPKEPTILDDDLNKDYGKVRKNYEDIIRKGVDAIDDILEIARNSEHPRAFEVAATLIDKVTQTNEKLILLQKQMREMNKSGKESPGATKIDKAIFIGSTSELSKLLKNNKEETAK